MAVLAGDPLLRAAPPSLLELSFPGVAWQDLGQRQVKDVVPIAVSYARTRGNPNAIEVVFSAAVDPASATNKTHYTLSPAGTVNQAVLGANTNTIWLTTTLLDDGVIHTLTVNGVQDLSSPPNTVPANSPVLVQKAQGIVTRRKFDDLGWCYLDCLTNDARFPNNPTATAFLDALESPQNLGDTYGLHVIGFLHPPVPGEYTFYVSADDQAVVFLSTDETPSNKVAIASVPSATGWRLYDQFGEQQSGYVTLQAGRRYYLEVLMAEGFGDDHFSVTWRLRGMPAPTNGAPPIPGQCLSSITASGPAGISVHPQDVTVAEGEVARFEVSATGTPPYTYQWLRDGVPIPGATAAQFSVPAALSGDNGARFSVLVSNWFSGAASRSAALTVTPDATPPAITRVSGNAALDRVTLTFSEPVTLDTAMDPRHYQISGGVAVNWARLMPDQSNVVISTTLLSPGTVYSLSVTGVTDTAALHNPTATSSQFTAWVLSRGFLHRQAYYDIPGATLSELFSQAKYPDWPEWSGYVAAGEVPATPRDYDMGERLVGFVLPPLTGFYVFYLSSHANGALYLSFDDTPANKRLIASEPLYNGPRYWIGTERRNPTAPENRSAAIYLEAGRQYYVEAVMKNDCCGDNLGFTWQMPGAAPPQNGDPPVSAPHLATPGDPVGAVLTLDQQPHSATVQETWPTNFSVAVSASFAPVFYQWQRNGLDLAGANQATLDLPRVSRDDHQARFQCLVSVPGKMLLSEEAILTVLPDNTAPAVVSAATLAGSTTVGICFDEVVDPSSVTNPTQYVLSTGGAVTGIGLQPDGRSVALEVNRLSFTNYTLRLSGVSDYAGNPLPAGTAVPVTVHPLEERDLGWPWDPIEKGSVFTCAEGQFEVWAGGGDFSDAGDRGHFVYQGVEGDFDVAVRVALYQEANCYSQAGLMARQNLTPGSPMVNVTVFPPTCGNLYAARYRPAQDALVDSWPAPSEYGFPGVGVPVPNAWVRLTRTNQVFTAYASSNGTEWVQFSQLEQPLASRLFVGLASSAQNNSAGVLERAIYLDYRLAGTPVPLSKPDLLVKKGSDGAGAFAIAQVYQPVPWGTQELSQWASIPHPAVFTVQVRNSGPTAQSFVVRAAWTPDPNWTARYADELGDITAQITQPAGWMLPELAPGASKYLTVVLAPDTRAAGGTTRSTTLAVFTDADAPVPRDAVKVAAINELVRQPDLQVRRVTDVNYAGAGIYSSDGSNQTKRVVAEQGTTVVYPLLLRNDGNLTNTFSLRGSGSVCGWTLRYFDALSEGSDCTAAVLAGSKYLTLLPGASYEFRLEMTLDLSLPGGSSNMSYVTVTYLANTNSLDTVRMVTTVLEGVIVPLSGLYTLDRDFEQGTLAGTAYGGDVLFLSEQTVTLPYLWVPNSYQGSVSKVDTRTGRELARYRTGPPGAGNGNPSRTTVDPEGNCWVVNRVTGTLVKIGLLEAGNDVDRNGDGLIQTSQDLNGDGNITEDEILPWGGDECLLYEVVLIPGREGTFVPGTYTGGYMGYTENNGPRAVAADAEGNVWAGNYLARRYYFVDGATGQILRTNDLSSVGHTPYGAVVDAQGYLWSAGHTGNHVLRLNPADNSFLTIALPHVAYGLGLDRSNHLFVSGWESSLLSRIDTIETNLDWTVPAYSGGRGVAATADGNFWVACTYRNSVLRYSADGLLKAEVPVGAHPTGLSVDAAGKVWAVDLDDEDIHRVDPSIDRVDLTKRVLSGNHYGYSDMTGTLVRNTTSRYGTWTVVHDAGVLYAQWGRVSWTTSEPAGPGANVGVRVRSSNDQNRWSTWEKAVSGAALNATPPGRYLQVEVALHARIGEPLPVLSDLTLEPSAQRTADLAIAQTATPARVTNDQVITYFISVTNRGPQNARGVILSNWLGAGASIVAVSNAQGTLMQTGRVVRCDLGLLAANTHAALTLWVLPSKAGLLTNVAAISSFENDPWPANNRAVLTTEVAPLLCLEPPANLAGWWPGEGWAGDLAGTNHGTLGSAVTFVAGKVGQAFRFTDAPNSFVAVPNSPVFQPANQQLTIEAWIKPDWTVTGDKLDTILAKGDGCANVNSYAFGVGKGHRGWLGNLWFSMSSAFPAGVASTGTVPNDGQFHHAAATFNGQNSAQNLHLFVDGQIVGVFDGPGSIPVSESGPVIGRYADCGYYSSAAMDEISFYGRELTPAEVLALYHSRVSGKCKPLSPVPLITIGRSAQQQCTLSWPAGTGLILQSAACLEGSWQMAWETPVQAGSSNMVVIPLSGEARFYRLGTP
jgi:uncharacterized repeat protein (TIGR01451 family)